MLKTPKTLQVSAEQSVGLQHKPCTANMGSAHYERHADGKVFMLSRLTLMAPQQDLAGKGSPQI